MLSKTGLDAHHNNLMGLSQYEKAIKYFDLVVKTFLVFYELYNHRFCCKRDCDVQKALIDLKNIHNLELVICHTLFKP